MSLVPSLPVPGSCRRRQLPGVGLLLAATAVSGLAACTSEDGSAPDTDESQQTLEGEVPESGWWCRSIERSLVEAVAGDRTDEAREVLRQNDTNGVRCEVVLPGEDGESQTLMTLAVAIDDKARAEQAREQAQQVGAEPGPDHLGESYVWPGTAVAIVPCAAPVGHERSGEQVAYVFSVHTEEPLDLPGELVDPVRNSLVEADQAVGCSPSEARQPDGQG